MRQSCEVGAERGWNLLVRQRWRFVAAWTDRGRDAATESPWFWSGGGLLYPGKREREALRGFLHRLALDGWEPWGADTASGHGRAWYAHRLYRDTP